jgi:hypothetical protein
VKANKLNVRDAEDNKVAAFLDARLRNSVNKTLYSAAQVAKAIRMRDALAGLYDAQDVLVNYRKTKITVKVAGPYSVLDKKALRYLEDGYELQGITKSVTPQGVIYSIK